MPLTMIGLASAALVLVLLLVLKQKLNAERAGNAAERRYWQECQQRWESERTQLLATIRQLKEENGALAIESVMHQRQAQPAAPANASRGNTTPRSRAQIPLPEDRK